MKMQLLIFCAAGLLLMSCNNPMTFRTRVNEDGSLEKTMVFEKAEKKTETSNIFGIDEKHQWAVSRELLPRGKKNDDKEEYRIAFHKRFASAEDMNRELDKPIDTLFHVRAHFDKKFRWFYTYIRYSETIRPINRFKKLDVKKFFNQEDSLFIQRLPSEGQPISSADSVFLETLNEKISDRFANMAIFYETHEIITQVVRKHADPRWLDTLAKKAELIYQQVDKHKGDHELAAKIADTFGIPLPKPLATHEFAALSKDLNARVDFMGFARDGKYVNEFEMPWEIVTSNADSISGRKLYWRPLVNKFIYMDYEMYAEARKINWWAVIVSGVMIVVTVVSFRRETRVRVDG